MFLVLFRYEVRLPDGFFQLNDRPGTGWNHIVLNYIGPDEGQGITLYNNGNRIKASVNRKT